MSRKKRKPARGEAPDPVAEAVEKERARQERRARKEAAEREALLKRLADMLPTDPVPPLPPDDPPRALVYGPWCSPQCERCPHV